MVKPWYHRFAEPLLVRVRKLHVRLYPYYRYRSIKVHIPPGVFHPWMVFSSEVLLTYIESMEIGNKRVLDLGTGSGILAIVCAARGARVVASDINLLALEACRKNAEKNGVQVATIQSDIFENLRDFFFDLILINPPYYPADPVDSAACAWFCGADYGYYHRLFSEIDSISDNRPDILMILGETAPLKNIIAVAEENNQRLAEVAASRRMGEWYRIYRVLSR